MKRLVVLAMLATLPSCTLIGYGMGTAVDGTAGTSHIGKDVGLRVGLGVDIALIGMLISFLRR